MAVKDMGHATGLTAGILLLKTAGDWRQVMRPVEVPAIISLHIHVPHPTTDWGGGVFKGHKTRTHDQMLPLGHKRLDAVSHTG